MTSPEHWQRVKQLFEAALQRPASDRVAFVASTAAQDAELASEVASLLVRSEELGEFLEPPLFSEPGDLRTGDRVGDFTLVSGLGRGGMGIVWLAQQESPRRAVALKVLSAVALSGESARRFRREADLLARLAHPGIAQVYEAGTDKIGGVQRPWFALELVDGDPIDAHARGLSVRERVDLVARVCDAVEHAHQRGIIHRDLKPQNILVTAAGEPKVLDFGIARASRLDGEAATLRTQTGLLLGTLDYMSPEQLAGDPDAVDARADVYALGVVLHELLLGRRPHDIQGRPIPEAVRILCEVEPAPLSSTDRNLRGDLETIVAKALAKERDRRYASASELATDLRRHLAERPIAARPASTIYPLREFARRNRGLVAGIAAAIVFLCVGVFGTTRGMLRALAAEKSTETRRADAERSATEAHEIQTFLEDILGSIQPDVAGGMDTTLVQRMLAGASARIDGRFVDQPLVEASLRHTLGKSYECVGLYTEARSQQERTLALLRTSRAPVDQELRATLTAIGSTWMQTAEFARAEPFFRESLALEQQRTDANAHDLASALANVGQCLAAQLAFADAQPLYAEAVRVLEAQSTGRESEDLPVVLTGLGTTLLAQGDVEHAEPLLARALEVEERVHPEVHTHRVECLRALASLRWAKRDFEGASAVMRESLEASRKLYGEKHPALVDQLSNLAMARAQAGDLDEAEAVARDAVEMTRALHIDAQPGFAIRLRDLGYVLRLRGRLEEAEALFRDALARQRETLGPLDPARLETLDGLADLASKAGRIDEAQELYGEALDLSRQALGPDHPTTQRVAEQLGAVTAARTDASH